MGDEQHQQKPQSPAITNMFEDTLALVGRFSFVVKQPKVAVLGRPGCGKSRLIEALLGHAFLPDIPTRQPLLVHLNRIRNGSDHAYAEFPHIPCKKFHDFNQIPTIIQAETEREFSEKELHVNIYLPNVLDITFVDLPGIPFGDGIEADRVRTIIMKYINSPTSLILAVTAATADIVNLDAVNIALTADPDSHRTFGVITKVDLMAQRTTDAAAVKPNVKVRAKAKKKALGFRCQGGIMVNPTIKAARKKKVFPLPPSPLGDVNRSRRAVSLNQKSKVFSLRYGYVGVVNRSQEDIILNRTIKDAFAAEQEFFSNHPVYNRVADRCGVPHLAKRMDMILVQHSKNYLRLFKLRAIAASGLIKMGEKQQQPQAEPPAIVNMFADTFALVGRFSFPIRQPTVPVLGRQGSGKSRLIEALVGRVFLPNIPTRQPILVHLKRIRDGSDQEYAEFLHIPGRKFYDFNQIRTEIQAETEREAGGGFSDKELHVNIFSPKFLDITFVDLPGIPFGESIEADRVRKIILKYINSPGSLILAVTPATADITNSDAVQIALTADPECIRTIGVLTKADLLPLGTTNAAAGKPKAIAIPQEDIVLNPTTEPAPVDAVDCSQQDVSLNQTTKAAGNRKVFPLRYGYVGIVNRSQEDIIQNRTIKEALAAEQDFFRNHPVFNRIADRFGVPVLAKRMDQLLRRHSKNYIRLLKSHAIAASRSRTAR